MGLTSLPTRANNSAGVTKHDDGPIEDFTTQIPAAEHNVIAQAIVDVCAAVGLADGSTAGSLVALSQLTTVSPAKLTVRATTTTTLPAYNATATTLTKTTPGALPAQDSITLTAGDRLLVRNETAGNAPNNGIYTVTDAGGGTAWVLTRTADFTVGTVATGDEVFVSNGTLHALTQWRLMTQPTITVGTTALSFVAVQTEVKSTSVTGATYTTIASDVELLCNRGGTIAVTLDQSVPYTGGERKMRIRDISGAAQTNNITITAGTAVTPAALATISTPYGGVDLVTTDGMTWYASYLADARLRDVGSRTVSGGAVTIGAGDLGGAVHMTHAGAVAVALPSLATSLNTGFSMLFTLVQEGAATLATVTPAGGLVDGAATAVLTVGPGMRAFVSRDGLNWFSKGV